MIVMDNQFLFNKLINKEKGRGPGKWPSDGFVFTPERAPYIEGTDAQLLKWKDQAHITVDFIYNNTELFVLEGTKKGLGLYNQIEPQHQARWLRDGTVVECCFRMGKWIPIRERADRCFPNPRKIVNSTVASMRENITEEEISVLPLGHRKEAVPEMNGIYLR